MSCKDGFIFQILSWLPVWLHTDTWGNAYQLHVSPFCLRFGWWIYSVPLFCRIRFFKLYFQQLHVSINTACFFCVFLFVFLYFLVISLSISLKLMDFASNWFVLKGLISSSVWLMGLSRYLDWNSKWNPWVQRGVKVNLQFWICFDVFPPFICM